MKLNMMSVSRILLVGLVVTMLPACETLEKFSADGHSDGTYRGNSYSSASANYVPGVVYPDPQGNELGYQALGRDLSGGSVEIYSLGGPEYVTPQQQGVAPIDSYTVNTAIPSVDGSVVVYEIGGAQSAQASQMQAGVILPPPSASKVYPSPFVATRDSTTIIAATPPVQDTFVETTTTDTAPISGPTMTAP